MDPLLELHRQAVLAHPSSRPFWDAAGEGRLLLPRCDDCGAHHWYPRRFCPACQGTRVRWTDSPGTARLHACTRLARDPDAPVVAYVELDEGPLMLSNVVGDALEALRIGDRLRAEFLALDNGLHVPVFRRVRHDGDIR